MDAVRTAAINSNDTLKSKLKDIYEIYNENEKEKEKPINDNDSVNHPSHYTYGKIEVIDFIEDKQLDFLLGNAVKYIARAGHKADQGKTIKEKTIEDLKKAVWYLNRKIKGLESGDTNE